MINKKQIKETFKECEFHVTPSDMRSRAEYFNFVSGDIQTDFSEKSEWYQYMKGVPFKNDKWTDNEYFHGTLMECGRVVFSDLKDLKNKVEKGITGGDVIDVITGDVFSYLTHLKSIQSGEYMLWFATTTSHFFTFVSDKKLDWSNPEKIQREIKEFYSPRRI